MSPERRNHLRRGGWLVGKSSAWIRDLSARVGATPQTLAIWLAVRDALESSDWVDEVPRIV